MNHGQPSGLKVLMRELWDTYKIPIAVTEVQLHCSRDEQLRWMRQVYKSCCELVEEGIDVRAITAWSLLGAQGWTPERFAVVGDAVEAEVAAAVDRARSASMPRPAELYTHVYHEAPAAGR